MTLVELSAFGTFGHSPKPPKKKTVTTWLYDLRFFCFLFRSVLSEGMYTTPAKDGVAIHTDVSAGHVIGCVFLSLYLERPPVSHLSVISQSYHRACQVIHYPNREKRKREHNAS